MVVAFIVSLLKASLLTAPIVILLLFHAKVRTKSSNPSVRLALWGMVGTAMILPGLLNVFFRWLFSLGGSKNLFVTDYSAVAMAFRQFENRIDLGEFTNTQAVINQSELNIYSVIAVVYILIAVGAMLYKLLRHIFYIRKLRRWSTKVTDTSTLAELKAVKSALGISRKISLIYSEEVSSPMLVGLFKPIIILPEKALSPEELHYVLSHELTHYRRKDLWLQLLFLAITAIYWPNPLVYLMQNQVGTDIELACDTKIVAHLSSKEKQHYCNTILCFVNTKNSILSTSFSSKNGTKKRMESILNKEKKKQGFIIVALAILLVLVMGACTYGEAPQSIPKEEATIPAQEIVLIENGELTEEAEESPLDQMENIEEFKAMQKKGQEEIANTFQKLKLSSSAPGETPTIELGWPVRDYYSMSSSYGWRNNGTDFHTGLDIAGKEILGKDVSAAADGEVAFVNNDYTSGVAYGKYIIVDHGNGISTMYSQLGETLVSAGQKIKQGEKLGVVGSTGFSTGPHLHFEVKINGISVDPYDFYKEVLEG